MQTIIIRLFITGSNRNNLLKYMNFVHENTAPDATQLGPGITVGKFVTNLPLAMQNVRQIPEL